MDSIRGMRPDIAAAIEAVCKETGVAVSDVLSRSRKVKICAARHEAIRAVAKVVKWEPFVGAPTDAYSSARIGKLFGRHYSTVLYALGNLKKCRQRARK